MTAERRLLIAPADLDRGRATIEGADHHYLFRVLRLAVGDRLIVFDGGGREATAEITRVDGAVAELRMDAATAAPAGPHPRVLVIFAVIKGDRTEWALQKLTELGVAALAPVTTARSVVKLSATRAVARARRYEAVVRAASQQCRRSTVPAVAPIRPLADVLAPLAEPGPRLVLHASADATPAATALSGPAPAAVSLLVGPEGGLTADEVALAREHGFEAVSLGPRILRAETAAIAAATIVGYAWGDLKGI